MRRKIIFSMLTLAAVAVTALFLWPLPFSGLLAGDAQLLAARTQLRGTPDTPTHSTADYRFAPDSPEAARIRQICAGYSFHRVPRTFFGDGALRGNDAGYWLHLWTGDHSISCGGTGEVLVDGRVYRIGYWGNGASLAMMREISALLGD
ncbi:MAG: hypothetical protein PHO66_05470 [Eubacteriales bacterium]|nr:hypothetical protein [Eubacteriales bacterium]